MNEKEFYSQILGLCKPWQISTVKLDFKKNEVEIELSKIHGLHLSCPKCGKGSPIYDHRERSWRHLDTCQLRTLLKAHVPRVSCSEHGVIQVEVPWSESNSSFTAMFETIVINWLQCATLSDVAKRLSLSWD